MRKWVVENIDIEPTAIFRKLYDSMNEYVPPTVGGHTPPEDFSSINAQLNESYSLKPSNSSSFFLLCE